MHFKLITLVSFLGLAFASKDTFVATGTGSEDDAIVDPGTPFPSDLSTDFPDLSTTAPTTGGDLAIGGEDLGMTVDEPDEPDIPDTTVIDKASTGGGKDFTTSSKGTKDSTSNKDSSKGSKDSGSITSSGLTCGACTAETPGGCTNWIYRPTFGDYRVFNFVCGCAKRITPESQCLRFLGDAVNDVEEFAVKQCGVHLRCDSLDFDPEPGSHTCEGKCPVGFGCFARCSTTCAYNVACTVITTV